MDELPDFSDKIVQRVLRDLGYDEESAKDLTPELLEKLRELCASHHRLGRPTRAREVERPLRMRPSPEVEPTEDTRFLKLALREAHRARAQGGFPIGSLLVRRGTILGQGHDTRLQTGNPVGLAELACLSRTGRLGNYRNTVLYTTSMSHYLAAGAVVQFKVPRVVAGSSITPAGLRELLETHGVEVTVLARPECTQLMEDFLRNHPDLEP